MMAGWLAAGCSFYFKVSLFFSDGFGRLHASPSTALATYRS